MPASVSTLSVCAGLILGAIGIGGYYLSNRDEVAKVMTAEPLFARSVEEAELSAGRWPTIRLDVPYYGPMVELLTFGASAGRRATDDQPAAKQHTEAAREPRTSREPSGVRKRQKRPNEKRRNENADAHDAYAREVPERNQRRGFTQRRDDDEEADSTNRRSRDRQAGTKAPDRRRDEGRMPQSRDRPLTHEDRREQESRNRRAPENRESGFTPFRMFGIFD